MRPLKLILTLGLLLLVFWGVDHAISKWVRFAEPILRGDLSSLQGKQIDIYVEMNKQLLTLASLVFAGVGLYFNLYLKNGVTLRKRDRNILVGTMLLAAFSIYTGYLSYDKIVWMLSMRIFNLDTPLLYWFRTLQFWSFVASILFFGWFWLVAISVK